VAEIQETWRDEGRVRMEAVEREGSRDEGDRAKGMKCSALSFLLCV